MSEAACEDRNSTTQLTGNGCSMPRLCKPHRCPDWDYMMVSPHHPEIECCGCAMNRLHAIRAMRQIMAGCCDPSWPFNCKSQKYHIRYSCWQWHRGTVAHRLRSGNIKRRHRMPMHDPLCMCLRCMYKFKVLFGRWYHQNKPKAQS